VVSAKAPAGLRGGGPSTHSFSAIHESGGWRKRRYRSFAACAVKARSRTYEDRQAGDVRGIWIERPSSSAASNSSRDMSNIALTRASTSAANSSLVSSADSNPGQVRLGWLFSPTIRGPLVA
jgi:hypothetical protein